MEVKNPLGAGVGPSCKKVNKFSETALNSIKEYSWPGNVRELKNTIKRAVLLAEDIIDIGHLQLPSISTSNVISKTNKIKEPLKKAIARTEKEFIVVTIIQNNQRKISIIPTGIRARALTKTPRTGIA